MMFYLLIKSLLDVPAINRNFNSLPSYKQLVGKHPELKEIGVTINLEKIAKPVLAELPALAATILYALTLPVWITGVRANIISFQLLLILVSLYFIAVGLRNSHSRFYYLGVWFYALSFLNSVPIAFALAPAYLYIIIATIYAHGNRFKTLGATFVILLTALVGHLYIPIHLVIESAVNSNSNTIFSADSLLLSQSLIPVGDLSIKTLWSGFKNHTVYLASELEWPMIFLLFVGLFGVLRMSKKLLMFMVIALLGCMFLWIGKAETGSHNLPSLASPVIGYIILIAVAGTYYVLRLKILSARVSILSALFIGVFLFAAIYDNSAKADMSVADGPNIISKNVLDNVPENSIVIIADENLIQPLWYRAYVDSANSSIILISNHDLNRAEYRRQLMKLCPQLIYPENFASLTANENLNLRLELCRLNAPERNVYIQSLMPGFKISMLYPEGKLLKYGPSKEFSRHVNSWYKEHINLVNEVLEGSPDENRTIEVAGNWLLNIGSYYEKIGDINTSWTLFKHALSIDYSNTAIRIHLAKSLAGADQYKESLKYIAEAMVMEPENQDILAIGRKIVKKMEKQNAVASQ
jgi:tetratricopeptide (TPR) repeat protein